MGVKYSILISSRNEGLALRRTVDSVLFHAPDQELEIVIVDDGSDDESTAFFDTAQYADQRIRLHRNDSPRGLIASRAIAADLAAGDYLCVLDAHCVLPPNWLEALSSALAAIDDRGLAVPSIAPLDPATWSIDQSAPVTTACTIANPFLDFGWTAPREIERKACTCTIGGGVWMCHRDWYRHIGGLDRDMVHWGGENIDLPLRTWLAGGMCRIVADIQIGHLFQEHDPRQKPGIDPPSLTYNKLRAAHTVFSKPTFDRVLENLSFLPGFDDALQRLRRDPESAGHLKGHFESVRERSDTWLIDTFELPVLEAAYFFRTQRRFAGRPIPPPRRHPRVSIVIAGDDDVARTAKLALDICERTAYINYDVLAFTTLAERAPDQEASLRALRNDPRVGIIQSSRSFAGGRLHDLAALHCESEYIVFLRNDSSIIDDHWIEDFILLFERRDRLLLAAPRVVGLDGDAFDSRWDWTAPGFCRDRPGVPAAEDPYQALSVPDACFAVHRERFLELGGFDRTVTCGLPPLLDLSIHGWLAGYEVFCDPEIRIGSNGTAAEPLRNDDPATAYRRVLPALKYFTNSSRLESCRRLSLAAEALIERNRFYIERRRRSFLEYARFDDDWLFFKFAIEDAEVGR